MLTVTATGASGTFTTTTMTAGGYQLQVPPGTYEVRVEGFPLVGSLVVAEVVMANQNVKVDFELQSANQAPDCRARFADDRGGRQPFLFRDAE